MGVPSRRDPALSVALWLSWGAALGVAACVLALLAQSGELQALRAEVAKLKEAGGSPLGKRPQVLPLHQAQSLGESPVWRLQTLSRQRRGAVPSHRHQLKSEAWARGWGPESDSGGGGRPGPRMRCSGEPQLRRAPRTLPPPEKRSVLHLAPTNKTSRKHDDVTEVMWIPALRQGHALEPHIHGVQVRETGVYLLYSQVLFHDVTFTMGQVVSREGQGGEQILSRCVRSMPPDPNLAYNSCYSAGVFRLHRGDTVSLIIPRAGASFDLSPHGTFLGLVRL
uniref:TNF superfamily member 13 n=1 Tax=Ornithorhynchus anatinus TaxID=9258 RepID=A0A6I8NQV4_ORNAN